MVAPGLTKVTVGLSRNKPFGFLLLLIAFIVAIGVFFFIAQAHPRRTALGEEVLERSQEHHAHAASSPRDSEFLFACALTGSVVLVGTHLAEFQGLERSSGSGG